ncbi:acetyl-CoA carboxylase / biotin carboxylase 1 [Nematocida major]|uniref:acetyl-CoA carboxylase / biotin carboxylase 1 n=1 Tax=Nematocida major TaxID=1912982 RepID=UPI002007AAFC|nr:acetyl-CoA carboxylase / biotin carboxylase 1 [Nematocida major]KAH9385165.1 acetyl-CoA carboxylase / biotin carboxylase 1 [Nematocida major]
MEHFMERTEGLERFLANIGGEFKGNRIFVGNNSLAAFKFILSMQDFSYRRFGKNVFEFYGLERPSDRASRSKYLDMLTGCIEVATESTEDSFKSPSVICEGAVHFNCQFVWPGWGHCSEDPALPRECERRGLTFIGPSEHAMGMLGSKISANTLADSSGIRSIPWIDVKHADKVDQFCKDVGYPVMVKSPDGGGGKGIRVVESPEHLQQAIRVVKDESGCTGVFVTKYLGKIKHIELQLLADSHGSIEVVSSRDCTMQRRNQKLIEEGPAMLDMHEEEDIKEKAKTMLKEAKYQNACTVEFVYDVESSQIYFLECNPRLQVEHTVTDLLTESNLCAAQWLVSCGVSIRSLQEIGVLKKPQQGRHVVAARVVAESAECGFVPSTGSVFVSSCFQMGTVGYFSIDSGAITPYNDSQFGHVFGIGQTRSEAVRALKLALNSVRITGGVKTLNNFLADLIATEEFLSNAHTTRTPERFQQELVKRSQTDPFLILCFCAISAHRSGEKKLSMNFQTNGLSVFAEVTEVGALAYAICINGEASVLEILPLFDDKYRVKTEAGEVRAIYFSRSKIHTEVRTERETLRFTENSAGNTVYSSVPGRVVRLLKSGSVKKDEVYLEIESMKNLIQIKAPKEGALKYKVEAEEVVEVGDALAEIVGDESVAPVQYTRKILYRNTEKDYTPNLFKGYEVPTEIQSFSKSTILQAMEAYSGEACVESVHADGYIKKSLEVLLGMESEIAQFKSMIPKVKYKMAKKGATEAVKAAYDLQTRIKDAERAGDLSSLEEALAEKGIGELDRITGYADGDTLLLLSLQAEKRDEVIRLWAKKVLGALHVEITAEESGACPRIKISAQADANSQMHTFYLLRKHAPKDTPDSMLSGASMGTGLEIPGRATVLEVDGVCVNYRRRGLSSSELYDCLDIRTVEVDGFTLPQRITEMPSPVLKYVLWNRRVSVYVSGLGSASGAAIHCMLALDEVMKMHIFSELVGEIESICALVASDRTVEVFVHVCEAFPDGLPAEYFRNLLSKACPTTAGAGCKWTVSGMCTESGQMETFSLVVRAERGFKEAVLSKKSGQVFYTVDGICIKNTLASKPTDQALTPSSAAGSCIEASRKKAKSLSTLYLYDAAALLGIMVQELHSGLAVSKIPNEKEAAISGWRFTAGALDFIFLGNDITVNNGAFSIDEDNYFSRCADISLKEKIPFVYMSSNSGAKIEVLEAIKPLIRYDNSDSIIYIEPEDYAALTIKEQIEVVEREIGGRRAYEVTDILGVYGMGVENLSYSAQIAKDMARLYKEVPTMTYVSGRAVGIGAYLASIGGRIIQKADSPIILTGFNALNSLLQKEIYRSNIEIGGPSILEKNGVVHKTVKTDSSGMQEVVNWLQYVQGAHKCPELPSSPNSLPLDGALGSEQIESLTPEEIVSYISDRDTFTEYLSEWAPNVRIGRARINGIACGVIFPRTGTVHGHIPAPAAIGNGFKPKEVVQYVWTENVLFSESSKKIALSIRDFSLESLPILILLNWKGFSAGHLDMFDGVLQNGSEIVRSMESTSTKIFTYLAPLSELRGGSWVVFDKKIGNQIKFTAHPTAKGSVIHPDGLSKIKCKQNELSHTLEKSGVAVSKTSASKLAKAFCALHDSSKRMIKMEVIDEILTVSQLKPAIIEYFRN